MTDPRICPKCGEFMNTEVCIKCGWRDNTIHPNMKAFLDMVAFAELGPEILKRSDNGFNVIVGSTPNRINIFYGYEDHPRRVITFKSKNEDGSTKIRHSTAAGRYQILRRIFDFYKHQLKLKDFSPESQDKIAMQLIAECGATEDIKMGLVKTAINKCRSRWASFPGSEPDQPERKMADLVEAYEKAGGYVFVNQKLDKTVSA